MKKKYNNPYTFYPAKGCLNEEIDILYAASAWINKRLTEDNDLETFESFRKLAKEIDKRFEFFQDQMIDNCSNECGGENKFGGHPIYCPCGCEEIPKEKHKP